MTAVFISYAREDQHFVQRLYAALDGMGRDAWVDWQGIAPTAEWMTEIRRAIDGADAALFVISPDWVASHVCGLELAHAVQQGKRLVPLVWRDAPEGSVPEALARLNWVMLREADDFDKGLQKLVAGLDTDLEWVRDHTRLIVRAQEWQTLGQDDAGLLRGRELDAAERWLAAGASHTDPAPVPLQAAFITRSREAARRRQRLTRAAVAAAFVITVALALWAFVERDRAIDNAAAAERSAQVARVQEGLAKDNAERAVKQEGIANEQRTIAEQEADAARRARDAEATQRVAAQAAQREAERQRDEAVRQRTAALARQLAARAEALPAADPALMEKSALLAAESLRLLPSLEADQVLRRAIARLPVRHAGLAHAGIVDNGALHGEGRFVAFVDAKRMLRVIDAGTLRETFQRDLGRRVRQVQVNRSGRYVVVAGEGDETWLLSTGDGSIRRIEDCSAIGAAFGGRTASLVALGCRRGVRLIEAADPTVPPRSVEGDDDTQLALAFSPDSETLAGVDEKGNVTAWNVADGKRLGRVRGQESTSSSWSRCCTAFIGFSAGGDYLAANNLADKQLHVISTRNWETHARLPHDARVNVFAFDERRDLLASGDFSGRITVWDVPRRAIVAQMGHGAEITHLRLYASPWTDSVAPELLSASTDRTARVWDPFSGAELARVSHITPVLWVDRPWEPHFGKRISTLDNYTGLAQWGSRASPAPLRLSARRGDRVPVLNCIDQANARDWFVDASGTVAWDPSQRAGERYGASFVTPNLRPVAIDPACRWLALSSGSNLRIIDPAGSADRTLFEDRFSGGSSRWRRSPRGALLVMHDSIHASQVWRTATWARLDPGEGCRAGQVEVSPDERSVAVACGDHIRVLDVVSGRETARPAARGLVALTDARQLIVRAGRQLSVLQLPAGQLLGRVELPEALQRGEAAASPDGRVLAIAGAKAVGLYRLPTLARLALEDRTADPARAVFSERLQFSPDSSLLLVHGEDRLWVFDSLSLTLRSELIHPGRAELVAWDLPSRRLLAQVSHRPLERETQFSVRAWNLDRGAELLRVPLDREAGSLGLEAGGRFLLADQVYRLAPAELADTACKLVTRNLTRREWQAELGGLPYQRTCANLPEPPPGTLAWDQ